MARPLEDPCSEVNSLGPLNDKSSRFQQREFHTDIKFCFTYKARSN